MHFNLVDAVLESETDRIVTVKQVTSAEEYLLDHFPGFPILPGVMMLEAMTQAARELLRRIDPDLARSTLTHVRALKYGAMVKPGAAIRVEVQRVGESDGSHEFRGSVRLVRVGTSSASIEDDAPQAASGRFALRPARFAGSAEPMVEASR